MKNLIIKDDSELSTFKEVEKCLTLMENTESTGSIYPLGVFEITCFLTGAVALSGFNVPTANLELAPAQNHEAVIEHYRRAVETPHNYYVTELSELSQLYHTASFTKDDVIKKIVSFKSLINKWDGYGALPLEVEAASNAIILVNKLNDIDLFYLDDIYPNPNGTVSLEWKNKSLEYISLEVGNISFSYYTKFNEMPPAFYDDVEINDLGIHKLSQHIKAL